MLIELIVISLSLFLLWDLLKKPPGYPPGLWGLPFVGHLPILQRKSVDQYLTDLQKKYGDVVIWRFGTQIMIFVYDFKLIRECMNRDEFSDRPELTIVRFLDKENRGIIGSNGQTWVNNRRFTLRQLRDLGMGKSRLASAVQQEAEYLVEDLKKYAGKPTRLPHSLAVAVVNVIWQMVSGSRYELNDPRVVKMEELIQELQSTASRWAIADFMPWLNLLMPNFLFRKLLKQDAVERIQIAFKDFFKQAIDDCESHLDSSENNFIDAYLAEMKKQEHDPESTMSRDDLLVSISDLFGAGSETTTTTLQWTMLYLANYPEVQKKLQEEVDEVLPKGTLATMEDKPRLPYTECVIHEIHRYVSFINIGVMHSAKHDTQLAGHRIPKGAIILSMVGLVHHDIKYWKNPGEFYPERFLDEEGKFSQPKEAFIPFGIGKRQCVGESLARMELLIFLTTLVQSFDFSPPPGKKMDVKPLGNNPFARLPNEDQDIVITIR